MTIGGAVVLAILAFAGILVALLIYGVWYHSKYDYHGERVVTFGEKREKGWGSGLLRRLCGKRKLDLNRLILVGGTGISQISIPYHCSSALDCLPYF